MLMEVEPKQIAELTDAVRDDNDVRDDNVIVVITISRSMTVQLLDL
jgi:hypothetical protein